MHDRYPVAVDDAEQLAQGYMAGLMRYRAMPKEFVDAEEVYYATLAGEDNGVPEQIGISWQPNGDDNDPNLKGVACVTSASNLGMQRYFLAHDISGTLHVEAHWRLTPSLPEPQTTRLESVADVQKLISQLALEEAQRRESEQTAREYGMTTPSPDEVAQMITKLVTYKLI